MAREAWETVVAFKLVWMRVAGYFIIPAWGTWEIATKEITGAQWDALMSFDKFKIIGTCFVAGLVPFLAFLDQSLHRARQEHEIKKNGNTQFFEKNNTGP